MTDGNEAQSKMIVEEAVKQANVLAKEDHQQSLAFRLERPNPDQSNFEGTFRE